MKSFKPQPWLLPQPVLIIGTYDEQGRPNAMNAAWGGQWDMKEIMISMGKHATTENLNRQGDFTVAFATQATMTAADYVGIVSAKNNPQKMEKTGWTAIRSENIDAPVFTDFPMTFECRIKEKIHESDTGYYIVAEVVNILADERYLADDGKRILDPYQPGGLQVDLKRKNNQPLQAKIEFPLNSLYVPRRCPNGKPAHVSWKFCPWTGAKLPSPIRFLKTMIFFM